VSFSSLKHSDAELHGRRSHGIQGGVKEQGEEQQECEELVVDEALVGDGSDLVWFLCLCVTSKYQPNA
jgi:hypothetical protein